MIGTEIGACSCSLRPIVSIDDDFNLYAYTGNNPLSRSDPTGLWSPGAHDELLLYAFQGRLPPDQIQTLQTASREFDKRTQATDQSHMHAMRQEGEAMDAALKKNAEFVSKTMAEARTLAGAGKIGEALTKLGEAMHPAMDSASPAHTDSKGDMKEWKGIWDSSALDHSPNDLIGSERKRDLTLKIKQSQKKLLNAMYSSVFPSSVASSSVGPSGGPAFCSRGTSPVTCGGSIGGWWE